MRVIAYVLAAFAAVSLALLLVLPRGIDTPAGRRALVEALSDLTGTPVTVEGTVEFDLLPRPSFILSHVRIGDREGPRTRSLRGRIDRIDLELDWRALVAGRLAIGRLTLVRPDLELVTGDAATDVLAALAAPVRAAEVIGGRLRLSPAGRAPLALEEVDLLWRTHPADGGRHIEARARLSVQRLGLELEAGMPRPGGRTPVDLRLALGSGGEGGEIAFSGILAAADRFSGDLSVALNQPQAASLLAALLDVPVSPALAAHLLPAAVRARIETEDSRVGVRTGEIDLPQGKLQVEGRVSLGTPPVLDLDVAVPQGSIPAGALLSGVAALLHAPPRLLVAGEVGFSIDRLELAGFGPLAVRGTLRAEPDGRLHLPALEASFVGGGRLRLDALLAPQSSADAVRASLALTLPSLPETLAASGIVAPEWAAVVPRMLTADVELRGRAGKISLDRFETVADAMRFSLHGELQWAARPRLDIAGRIVRPALAPLFSRLHESFDPWTRLVSTLPFDVGADLEVESLDLGGLRAERSRLRFTFEERVLRLLELEVEDIAGARASLAGVVDVPTGALDLDLDAAVPAPARLARQVGVSAAPVLVALGSSELRAHLARRGGLSRLQLTLGTDRLSASADIRTDGAALADLLALDLRLAVPDLAGFAREAGVALAGPPPSAAGLELGIAVTRQADGRFVAAAEGELAAEAFTFDGNWRLSPDRIAELAGTLRADRLPPVPLLDVLWRLSQPALGLSGSPPWSWPGAWPATVLAGLGTRGFALAVGVELAETGGSFRLLAAPDRLSLEELHWPLAGGTLEGQLQLAASDGKIDASGRLRLRHLDLARLFAEPSPLGGRLELDLEFAGEGRSPAEIVAGLRGSGRLALPAVVVPDPRLPPGPLPAAQLAQPLTGSLGGEVRLRRGLLEAAGGRFHLLADPPLFVEGRVDFYAWMLDARVLDPSPSRPQRELARLFGPLGRPVWQLQQPALSSSGPSVGGPEHPFGPH